eukprot:2857318-Prymnesium_polylepis.1
MVDAAGVFGCFNHRPCAFPPAPAGTHSVPPGLKYPSLVARISKPLKKVPGTTFRLGPPEISKISKSRAQLRPTKSEDDDDDARKAAKGRKPLRLKDQLLAQGAEALVSDSDDDDDGKGPGGWG